MGKESSKDQAHSRRGRGLNGTHADNNVGEATRGKGHKNQKAQQQQSNVSCLKHTELKCFYTNADSFINKFSEFKGPATRNDFVNDIVNDARAEAIFATLRAIVDDEKSTISSTISLRVAWPLRKN